MITCEFSQDSFLITSIHICIREKAEQDMNENKKSGKRIPLGLIVCYVYIDSKNLKKWTVGFGCLLAREHRPEYPLDT